MPSNLSISVTDEFQVASIDPTITIKEGLSLEKLKILKPISLTYTNESGVSIAGQFINNKSNGEKAVLNVMQIEQQRLTQIETDETGIFMLNDLQFYDSTTFSFKPIREKDVAYGNVKIRNRETPPMFFKDQSLNLNIIKTMLPQRTLSEYEMPRDARLLEAVVVKGKKIEQIKPYSQGPWSGRIIKGKDLNQTNLLFSLKNTPGVKVDMVSGEVRSSRGGMMTGAAIAAGLGQGNDGGSLYSLSIDGIPIQGPGPGYIGETLAALDPANIEFMYVGRTHIAVYMKRAEDINTTPAFQLLKIQGYSPPRSFRHPDYSNPKTDTTKADYRSTIYWNPNVITDSKNGTATVSFFAADLPGKYRIVAEGVTQNGEPVRCVYFIEVISN